MKTPKGIMALARDTLAGHRGQSHQDFRTVVAANGYEMQRGGWVKFGGENVCRGWEAFAYMVCESREIVLQDLLPDEAVEAQNETPAMLQESATTFSTNNAPVEYAGAHIFRENGTGRCGYPDCNGPGSSPNHVVPTTLDFSGYWEASHKPLDVVAEPQSEEFVYFYTTRTETIPLTENTDASAMLTETLTAYEEGPCESGAALDCAGKGFRRVLPESMLPGSKREQVIQCLPCYEASANAYVRKLHRYPA